MGGDFLEDFLVVLVVVAVSNSELHEGFDDGSIAVFDVLDDVVDFLNGRCFNLFAQDVQGQLQVADEGIIDFVAAVVLTNLRTTVERTGSVAGEVFLVGAEAGVEASECHGEVVHAFNNGFEDVQDT